VYDIYQTAQEYRPNESHKIGRNQVTHDNRILDVADRIINMEDGYLESLEAA
jgi:ABC-type lipoprotein export system ATPase subunit